VTSRERELEAPHRRLEPGPRILEKATVVAYRAASWLIGVLPAALPRAVLGGASQASYLLWPTKRNWSNRNFGHVLGLPPDDPRVRRLALRAYAEYGRYLVELMRLTSRGATEANYLAGDIDADGVRALAAASPGGLILAAAHVGSNEAVAASIARHGLPISAVADDSAFPELYDLLRRQRESWGIELIAWRNLRGIFGALRRRRMLALLIDWGYRADGIPVQLFGAWTTLPAGPATLAAKTNSHILSIDIRRRPDGAFGVGWTEPIVVTSGDPAELQRATQQMADNLAAVIRLAPEQWYSFKPMWPSSPDAARDLERRARAMQAGQPDPGPARGRPPDEAELAVDAG
jgi:phosphatidylinositol dimannoside acyltransferase